MKLEQRKLVEFHALANQARPSKPVVPPKDVQQLRLNLHEEEAVIELRKAFEAGDLVEIADSIGDALYVVLGTAVACGIDIEPIFDAIHVSNMTKFIDGYRREDGKWVKGPSYVPVDLRPIIEAQLNSVSAPVEYVAVDLVDLDYDCLARECDRLSDGIRESLRVYEQLRLANAGTDDITIAVMKPLVALQLP